MAGSVSGGWWGLQWWRRARRAPRKVAVAKMDVVATRREHQPDGCSRYVLESRNVSFGTGWQVAPARNAPLRYERAHAPPIISVTACLRDIFSQSALLAHHSAIAENIASGVLEPVDNELGYHLAKSIL